MTTISTNFTPTASYFPFAGKGALTRDRSDVPRAEVRFLENGAAVTLSGAGDDQRISVICDLPINFAYVISELHLKLSSVVNGVTVTWQDVASASFRDGGSPQQRIPFEGSSTGVSGPTQDQKANRIYQFNNLPLVIWKMAPGAMGNLQLTCHNINEEEPAVTMDFYARFLQFDLEQAIHYAPNVPTLTR